jgi:predicted outer membrane protein
MSRTTLAALFIPLLLSGAAFARAPVSGSADNTERAAKLGEVLSVLHALDQYSINVSAMADKRAKSDLVKGYALAMSTANTNSDAKLKLIAQKYGAEVVPLDPQTEEGKSLRDRIAAETMMLVALEGDAWDKEYMTLVTNMQQSTINFLEANKASARDADTKQFLGELATAVRNRLKTAQDIMTKVYGDRL